MPPQVVHVKNASKIAAALSNPKCQRILEYLDKKADATESGIAKDLSIPLSTVHYNMKLLTEANLVLSNEYTYSVKGKEVTHYKRNKNPIVIIQEEQQLDLLKAIAPAALIAAGIGIAYAIATKATPLLSTFNYAQGDIAVREYAPEAGTMMMKAAPAAQAAPVNTLPWFIAGVVTTFILSIVLLFIYRWWSKRLGA
jgi:DNA-binding transcriptional ArsR family regulator